MHWPTGGRGASPNCSPRPRRIRPCIGALLEGRDPASLFPEELPVMRKAELMGRFDEWVADPRLRLDALRRFVADKVYDALEALRRPVLRPLQRLQVPGASGSASPSSARPVTFASVVSIERLRRLNPALSGRLHSISFLQPTEALVAELDTVAPTVVATYPSAAVLLAEERWGGRLHASPGEVWTGGEDPSAAQRESSCGGFAPSPTATLHRSSCRSRSNANAAICISTATGSSSNRLTQGAMRSRSARQAPRRCWPTWQTMGSP
jgi:hypothetical protein